MEVILSLVVKVAQMELRSEEHTSELQSLRHLVCRLLLEKKKKKIYKPINNNKKKHIQKNKKSNLHIYTTVLMRQFCFLYVVLFLCVPFVFFFFFNDTATTEIYTLSLHDALPILGFAPDPAAAQDAALMAAIRARI